MTQSELADRLGVAPETISRIERGAVIPSLVRLLEIGEALGVELHELLRLRERPTAKDAAIERLVALVRRHRVTDIQLIADLAERILLERR